MIMKKLICQIAGVSLLCMASACSSTKLIKHTALPKILHNEGILLSGIKNLNEYQSLQLYESAKKQISKTNNVKYLPEQEYFLVSKGVPLGDLSKNPFSDSLKSNIALLTQSRYIIEIEVLDAKDGDLFGSYAPQGLQDPYNNSNLNTETNTAKVLFTVFDTKGAVTESKFQINAHIHPLAWGNTDGRQTRINLKSSFTAISKAFNKGIKRLQKDMISN